MVLREFPNLGEKLYTESLPNGLTIYILVKPGYNKSFAAFCTNYGGADRRFKYGGEWIGTPAGVAHFLEHKMFDTEDGNALEILSSNGASPNAWTSSAMTAYHFESTESFWQNLEMLLSFVSVPYFTPESVDKEQGIIGQEIRMMDDTPGFVVYQNLLKALYKENPLRDSVAGSIESIAEISDQTLYACHKVFYNPSNMVLCVAGDVDPQKVVDTALKILPKEPGERPERDYGTTETQDVYSPITEVNMEVSAPQFLFGCRAEPAPKGEARLRQRLLGDLALEYLMGKPSHFFTDLYAKGLLRNDFGAELMYSAGSAVIAAGGESRDPKAVLDALMQELDKVKSNGIDPTLFKQVKNSMYGDKIRALGTFSGICFEIAECHFAGCCPLDGFAVLDSFTEKDLKEFITQSFKPGSFALSVVNPAAAAVK